MKGIKAFYSVLWLILLLYVIFSFQSMKVLIVIVVVALMLISLVLIKHKERQIYKELSQISSLVQSLIDGHEAVKRLSLKDELTSKLEFQILKLADFLEDHRTHEKVEKERLESLIADISHQLKTPLSNLMMYIDLVESPLEENKASYDAITNQTHKLEWLVTALLSLSKLESGCIELSIVKADINTTLLNAIGQIHLKAKEKNINVVYEPKSIVVEHDVKWTGEAIYNILDNAIKYSAKGTEVTIELIKQELFTKIKIRDQGIGIDKEETNLLFKRFYRSNQVHEYEGVGIGLYLAQEILMKQGGYIYAIPTEQGSSFEINIRH